MSNASLRKKYGIPVPSPSSTSVALGVGGSCGGGDTMSWTRVQQDFRSRRIIGRAGCCPGPNQRDTNIMLNCSPRRFIYHSSPAAVNVVKCAHVCTTCVFCECRKTAVRRRSCNPYYHIPQTLNKPWEDPIAKSSCTSASTHRFSLVLKANAVSWGRMVAERAKYGFSFCVSAWNKRGNSL